MNDIFDQGMRQVLKSRKYDVLAGRSVDVRKAVAQFIRDILERVFGRINIVFPQIGDAPGWIGYAVLAVAALIVFAAAALIIRAVVRRRRRVSAVPVGDIFAGVELSSLEQLLRDCGVFAAAGNYMEALRRMFIALLWSLNGARLIRLDKAKTNGQLKREIERNAPAYAGRFGFLSDMFSYAWYGKKGVDAEKWSDYSQMAQALMREAENAYQR